jgi:hypothetical protein
MGRKKKYSPVLKIGSKWDKLTIIRHIVGELSPDGLGLRYECQCSCSRQPHSRIEVWTEDLRSGAVVDCGCRAKTLARVREYRARKRKQAALELALQQRYTVSFQPTENTRLTVRMTFDELMGLPA